MPMASRGWVLRVGVALAVAAALPGGALASGGRESPLEVEIRTEDEARSLVTVGDHETRFVSYGRHRGRAHNVALAASLLDGAVIAPGGELSFNERVGERIAERGFRNAPVIVNKRIGTGVGGGVCQVASTLHVAALEAGLEIVEQRVHSFVSGYVAAGLDATVVDGRVDYRVRNPHEVPITVRAKARDGQLVVMLLSPVSRPRLVVETEVIRHLVADEVVVVDPDLAPGERVVVDEGRDGQVVVIRRRTGDGATVDARRVRYAATPRVVRVGG